MRSFVVTVAGDEAELAADRLWQLGVRAIEERAATAARGDDDGGRDGGGGGDGGDGGGGGHVELWTAVGDGAAAIDRAAQAMEPTWAWRVVDVPDRWPESWREHVAPMPVGARVLVVPAWLHPPDELAAGRVTVRVEPGAAFGLGDHPTTALTLAALDRELERRPTSTVLDVGCGTGILTVAAALLGSPRVRAVDVSGAAVEATVDNLARNGVAGSVAVDRTPVADLDGTDDLVLANVLAPALISMADDLRRLTAADGRLVVSGILAESHEHVLSALSPMRVMRTDVDDGWAAVTLAHPEESTN